MIDTIKNSINAVEEVCKKHHVRQLFVFGSAARVEDFNDRSDVDILVNFESLAMDTNEQVFYFVENKERLEEQLL